MLLYVTANARDYERDISVLWLVNTQQGGWEISRELDRAEQSGEQASGQAGVGGADIQHVLSGWAGHLQAS